MNIIFSRSTTSLPLTESKLLTTFDAVHTSMGNPTMTVPLYNSPRRYQSLFTLSLCSGVRSQILVPLSLRWYRDLWLTHIKAVPRASSIFMLLQSLICSTVYFPDPDHQNKLLVVDHIDSDMFLHMKLRPTHQ